MQCSVSHTRNAEVSSKCNQQTSTTINVVDDTVYSSARTQSWTWTTVAHEHKILGSEASEPETSRRVEKCYFYSPHLQLVPRLGAIPLKFCQDLLHHKTRFPELSCAIVWDHIFSHFDIIPAWDGDRQTTTAYTPLAWYCTSKNAQQYGFSQMGTRNLANANRLHIGIKSIF